MALPNADEYRAARRGIGVVFQNPEDQLVTIVIEAVEEADSQGLPLCVIGGGSNMLVSDRKSVV